MTRNGRDETGLMTLVEYLRTLGATVADQPSAQDGLGDGVFKAFLERQQVEGMELADASDLVEIVPLGPRPARRYIVRFRCRGLVRHDDGSIKEASHFETGIRFPGDYLRRADAFQVLSWLGPRSCWHPNISTQAPVVCIGHIAPGTRLVDLVYRLFDVITYVKVTPREDNALNRDACTWARRHQHLFPIDRRPLKRRALTIHIEALEQDERQ